MPWCPVGPGGVGAEVCLPDPTVGTDLVNTPIDTAIANIIEAGELKTDFIALSVGNTTKVFVTGSEALATATVCYKPTAKSFIKDPNTKFTQDGLDTCAAGDATQASCYWCVK